MKWALVLALAACAGEPEALSRDPASCAGCHPSQTASWRASRHAAAFVDGAFHAELEPRREAWCIGCHAPLADDPATVRDDDPRARDGVGCAACHAQHGDAPVTSARCAACHQFDFPVFDARGRVVRMTDHPMQETVAQAAGADCLGCHDPHRIAGSHDPDTRDRALAVTACVADGALRVSLTNVGAAHHVPTGGIDRHLVLRIWRSSAPDKLVAGVLGRAFEAAPDGAKRVVSDTTLAAGETRVVSARLDALGGDATEPVNVELVYVFAADERVAIPDTEIAATMDRLRLRAASFEACR